MFDTLVREISNSLFYGRTIKDIAEQHPNIPSDELWLLIQAANLRNKWLEESPE